MLGDKVSLASSFIEFLSRSKQEKIFDVAETTIWQSDKMHINVVVYNPSMVYVFVYSEKNESVVPSMLRKFAKIFGCFVIKNERGYLLTETVHYDYLETVGKQNVVFDLDILEDYFQLYYSVRGLWRSEYLKIETPFGDMELPEFNALMLELENKKQFIYPKKHKNQE